MEWLHPDYLWNFPAKKPRKLRREIGDFKRIFKDMESPATIFDTRNILNHQELFEIGFNVYQVGKKPLTH